MRICVKVNVYSVSAWRQSLAVAACPLGTASSGLYCVCRYIERSLERHTDINMRFFCAEIGLFGGKNLVETQNSVCTDVGSRPSASSC